MMKYSFFDCVFPGGYCSNVVESRRGSSDEPRVNSNTSFLRKKVSIRYYFIYFQYAEVYNKTKI